MRDEPTSPTSPHEPWLSRRHWRRLVDAWAAGRISRDEFDRLKRRLARVRAAPLPAGPAPIPLLRVIAGGRTGVRATPPRHDPFNPQPLEAA